MGAGGVEPLEVAGVKLSSALMCFRIHQLPILGLVALFLAQAPIRHEVTFCIQQSGATLLSNDHALELYQRKLVTREGLGSGYFRGVLETWGMPALSFFKFVGSPRLPL